MADLSPAATAVLDTYMKHCGWLDGPLEKDYRCAAAVLRAAADQTITRNRLAALEGESHAEARLLLIWVRDQFFAIAAELEGATHDEPS